MQSSQNRLPFDRSDPINSAVSNERDLGVFFYWETKEVRARFKELVDSGLKGSGDYGILGLGVYNGQTANKKDQNDDKHVVAHLTYPFKIGSQFVEASLHGYRGQYVITTDEERVGGQHHVPRLARGGLARGLPAAAGLPGRVQHRRGSRARLCGQDGPQEEPERRLRDDDAQARGLHPVRARPRLQRRQEGPRPTRPRTATRRSIGLEWLPWKALELTAAYSYGERTHPKSNVQESGHLLRLQAQFNY